MRNQSIQKIRKGNVFQVVESVNCMWLNNGQADEPVPTGKQYPMPIRTQSTIPNFLQFTMISRVGYSKVHVALKCKSLKQGGCSKFLGWNSNLTFRWWALLNLKKSSSPRMVPFFQSTETSILQHVLWLVCYCGIVKQAACSQARINLKLSQYFVPNPKIAYNTCNSIISKFFFSWKWVSLKALVYWYRFLHGISRFSFLASRHVTFWNFSASPYLVFYTGM